MSTDAGSVGLNLQAANVVINLDLPWNPAKLEQRIARAWRKHQTRSVQVINLISENSIEHRMLYLLEQKQLMAKGILTEDAEVTSMKMPSGRAAFMERMETLMGSTEKEFNTADINTKNTSDDKNIYDTDEIKSTILNDLKDDIHVLQTYHSDLTQQPTLLAVVNDEPEKFKEKIVSRLNEKEKGESISLETIDQKTLEIIQRLAEAGILTLNTPTTVLHEQGTQESKQKLRQKQLAQATELLTQAERKHRMAHVLIESDFIDEAVSPLREALKHTVKAFFHLVEANSSDEIVLPEIEALIAEHNGPKQIPDLFSALMASEHDVKNIKRLHADHQITMNHLDQMKTRFETELKNASDSI